MGLFREYDLRGIVGQDLTEDIAEQVGLDYWTVREYVEKFRAKGFVTPLPIPSEAQTM